MKLPFNSKDVNFPDFMIVGAAKSGTTSLDAYLKEHPDVFMPWFKETWFFHLVDNPNKAILKIYPFLPTNILSYLGLFADAKTNQVCGEATPSYLYYHDLTIANIKKYHPNYQKLKIVIILREPIDKVISHYKFARKGNLDPKKLSLLDALRVEKERMEKNKVLPDLFYTDNTMYYKQVKAYQDNFKNVKIFLYEELKENPKKLIKELYDYIGVNNSFIPNTLGKRFNPSKNVMIPRNKGAKYIINREQKALKFIPQFFFDKIKPLLLKEEKIDPKAIEMLKTKFKQDVINLQSIIDRDISHWIKKYE